MGISLIATVYNEVDSISGLLNSVAAQTRLPDEMVIVDGGSSDGTLALMRRLSGVLPFPLRVISAPGLNIAQGRNRAISEAAYPIVAVTDAGVRLDSSWLSFLTAPFDRQDSPDVVSGFFVAESKTMFERVLGAISLPGLAEIDAATFYPSSRSVAFTKVAWEQVGGYPEWLDYCEDLVFDFGLYDLGLGFEFVPEAVVYFRPRTSVRAFMRQYYRYARGDGKARLYIYRHLIRYATYGLLIAGVVLGALLSPWYWTLVGLVLFILADGPVRRIKAALARPAAWMYCQAVGLRILGDLSKMAGYPVGVVWRLRGNAPSDPWPTRCL